ncbi:MAG: DUF4839 domain-containing protein [Bacilli bacterium]
MKKNIGIIVAVILVLAVVGIGLNSTDHTGEAETPAISEEQKGHMYKDVIALFKEQGFTNIKTQTIKDLIFGWTTKDGEVEHVSVGGDIDYSANTWYPEDIEVIVTYHTFPDKRESSNTDSENKDDVKEQNKEKEKDTILTVDNNEDLKELLNVLESGEVVENFADKYKGKTIRFDGNIAHMMNYEDYKNDSPMMNHGDYKTRYDILVYAGDYSKTIFKGPSFKFKDKNISDLGLIGDNIPEAVTMEQNYTITAKVLEYNKTQELFFLEPISLEYRSSYEGE